jgi:hypothetical protein
MKKKFLLLVFSFLFLFLLFPSRVIAQEGDIVVKKGEIVNHDFFAAGNSITISGVVNGDVYAAGSSLTVDGVINGDLLGGAGNVALLGRVSDDVRVGGGNVLINGQIGKNLTVGCGNLIVTSEGRIGGSLLALAGMVNLKGTVGKSVNLQVGKATIASSIGGNLEGRIQELSLTSDAQIMGNLEYESEKEAQIEQGAVVIGKTTHKLPEKIGPAAKTQINFKNAPFLSFGLSVFRFYLSLFSFLIAFLFGLGFLFLFPKRAEAINKILREKYWRSLGVGFLSLLLFPLALILLTISLIGIPLIFIIIPFFIFMLYFGGIFTSLCLGKYILERRKSKKSLKWALFLGLIVFSLLKLLPFTGPVFAFFFVVAGLGGFLLDQKALRKR